MPAVSAWFMVFVRVCRCVLDSMFDHHFRVRPSFLYNEAALKHRLRWVGVVRVHRRMGLHDVWV